MKKIVTIPMIPSKELELYRCYGPSWYNLDSDLRIYEQYETLKAFENQTLVRKFFSLEKAENFLKNKIQDEIYKREREILKLKDLIKAVNSKEYKIEKLDDDINERG